MGSNANIWPLPASSASICASGVPALGQRRAATGGDDQLGRLVERYSAQRLRGDGSASLHGAADPRLGSRALDFDRLIAAGEACNHAGKLPVSRGAQCILHRF